MHLVRALLFGFAVLLSVGCTVHHHHGRPFAYGVQATDWVMEEQAQSCSASCGSGTSDAHLLCMSRCPGFVTAEVSTCRDVPEWDSCAMGYEASGEYDSTDRAGRNRAGEKMALGTLQLLGSVATALLDAADEQDEREDEDEDEDEREKQARSERKAKSRKKGSLREPFKPRTRSRRHPRR